MAKAPVGAVKSGAAPKAVTANSAKVLSGKANLSNAKAHAKAQAQELQKMKVAFGDASVPQAGAQSQSKHLEAMWSPNEVQRLHPTASVTSSSSPSNRVKQGAWLKLPIGNLSPDGSETSSGENQEEGEEEDDGELSGLLKFLTRHGIDVKSARQLTMKIQISNDDLDLNRHAPLFNQQTFGDHPSFNIWSTGMSL